MPLSERENYLRNASMTGPEWIPAHVAVSGASWLEWRDEMEEVASRHPVLFPNFRKGERNYDEIMLGSRSTAGGKTRDNWGCVWKAAIDGIVGQVVEHPLADWAKLADYTLPDPLTQADEGPVDWPKRRENNAKAREEGRLTVGGLAHGFLFMRLHYLRGYENFMCDVIGGPPQLQQLIDAIVAYNQVIVSQYLDMGVDMIDGGDDLGTQTMSMIGREHFHRWITPAYKKLFRPCRERGMHVALHSDGYTLDLMDEFIEAGVTIVNPQDLCNGIDALAREVKGRVCIRLDVDRQTIVPFGTSREIHDLIEEEVRKLGSPAGGLEFIAGIYPPTPPENVDALCSALEEFRTYWWDGRGTRE